MPTLDWVGKSAVVNHHYDVPFHFLDRSYGSSDENMIIHGDNLIALKSLLPRFEGKIKCIYIDPPYNTGNEGWVYNDAVNDPSIRKWLGEVVGREGEDFTRHDKWLCMMYPRMRLMQRLLSEDGAIFISIDDNEQANLKLICDEIFGAQNFIANISWFKKSSPSNDATYFSNDVEYITVYAKEKNIWRPNRLPLTDKQLQNYKNPDGDPRGPWNSATYTCNKTKEQRPNLFYPIINPNTGAIIFPKETAVWAYSPEQHADHIKKNLIWWGTDGHAKMPRYKKFLSGHQGVVNRTLWHYDDVNHTQGAATELKRLDIKFDTPKPVRLIDKILRLSTDKDSLVLDAFAGSGTTAHAVINLNAADGGSRRFILIESQPYAETITAERVRRVKPDCPFSFYEIGAPLFIDDILNPDVPLDQVRAYIYFSETRQPLPTVGRKYLLGIHDGVSYYYLDDRPLDTDFLFSTLNDGGDERIIYAPNCILGRNFLSKYRAEFKRIPSDIMRL